MSRPFRHSKERSPKPPVRSKRQKLINEIGDPVTLDPAEWQTFANLVPAFSFGALEAKYGRGTAVRMFHT